MTPRTRGRWCVLLVSALVAAAAALAFPASATSPATGKAEGSAKSATALITAYYQSILRRVPDPGGLSHWEGQAAVVQSLGADPRETFRALAITFFNSDEYRSFNRTNAEYVGDLYATFFARAADSAGLAYWTGQLQAGQTREGVLLWFLFSAEFDAYMRGHFGDTRARAETDIVMDLFRGFFARVPDEAAFRHWVGRLRAAQCAGPAAVAAEAEEISGAFFNSLEYAYRRRRDHEFLTDLYNGFLRRGPDLPGFMEWGQRVRTGAYSRDAVRRAFAGSPEFQARVQRVAADGCYTMAVASELRLAGATQPVSPFLATVELAGRSLAGISEVSFTVAPKPGTVSRPVQASYSHAYLARSGYATASGANYVVPIFGLYAGHANSVAVRARFTDGSVATVDVPIASGPWSDPTQVYDRPVRFIPRPASSSLGFDFFHVRNELTMPIVIDTDGEVRWWVPGDAFSVSTLFDRNGFVSSPDEMRWKRTELDGRTSETTIAATYWRTHHNIDPGPAGVLVEVDDLVGGVIDYEHILLEVAPDGGRIREWKLGDIIGRHMRAHGEDPAQFVRFGADWFHMNAAAYDARDDSLILSSRENFVIKIDYATGDIIWIFGDPTKYWYTFPSLRAKALELLQPGLFPVGQHTVSITSSGHLLLFNNGEPSLQNPPGTPKGEDRDYSAASAYEIDPVARTAREVRRFDYGRAIESRFCSGVYEANGSWLVSYSRASGGAKARLVGVDAQQRLVFDFEYANPGGCNAAFNAVPVPFDNLVFP